MLASLLWMCVSNPFMKSVLNKIIIATVIGGGAISVPVYPTDLELLYSYQYHFDQYQEVITLVDGKTTANNPQKPFDDNDGNNLISVSVFADNKGEITYVQIPDDTYLEMGKRGGEAKNPKQLELQSIYELMKPKIANGAVGYDTSTTGNANPGTSVTVSHTITGSDTLLLSGVITNDTTDLVTGCTWNGSAMSRVDIQAAATTNFLGYIYSLVGAETGTHNIVCSRSTSNLIGLMSASYTGVSQTGFPDSQAKGTDATGSYDMTSTVVASDSWLFANTRSNDADGIIPLSVGVKRQTAFAGQIAIVDSNGTVGTGSQTITVTSNPGGETYWLMVSFSPATGGGSTPNYDGPRLMWVDF